MVKKLSSSSEAVQNWIGTPKPRASDAQIENIMSQLRDRRIAREQVDTFAQKQISTDKQRELDEAVTAHTETAELIASLVDISMSEGVGRPA